jgi:hypothetical protein
MGIPVVRRWTMEMSYASPSLRQCNATDSIVAIDSQLASSWYSSFLITEVASLPLNGVILQRKDLAVAESSIR